MIQMKIADATGFVLCVAALLAGQIAMSRWLVPGSAQNSGIVQDIGYTFTGLTAALSFILWRWGRTEKTTIPTMPSFACDACSTADFRHLQASVQPDLQANPDLERLTFSKLNCSMPRYWLIKVVQAVFAATPVLFGCIYFSIAGQHTERYARSFAAIPPLMYLLTIKRHKQTNEVIEKTSASI